MGSICLPNSHSPRHLFWLDVLRKVFMRPGVSGCLTELMALLALCKHAHGNGCSCPHPLGDHMCHTWGLQLPQVASFALGYSETQDLAGEELELNRRIRT